MHMVIFASADGKPNYQQIEQLEEAVRYVERLRNEEGVTDAKLYSLAHVPLSFKTYYQVEVGASGEAASSSNPVEAKPVTPSAPASSPASPPASPPASAPAAETPPPVAAKAVVPTPSAAKPAPSASKPAVPAAQATGDQADKADAGANGAGGRFGLFGKS